jgi:hypothetical protein
VDYRHVGYGEHALQYLSRYLYRVALPDKDITCSVFQDSCHSLVDFYAASSIGLSGFNVTAPIALQS